MEDLIVSLQILAKSWREVSPLVGNGHLSVAADQLEGVLRNHQSAQQSVQSDGATTFRTTVTVTKSDAPPLEFEDEESPRH